MKCCLSHDKDTRNTKGEIFHESKWTFPSAYLPSKSYKTLSELSTVIDLIRWLNSRNIMLVKAETKQKHFLCKVDDVEELRYEWEPRQERIIGSSTFNWFEKLDYYFIEFNNNKPAKRSKRKKNELKKHIKATRIESKTEEKVFIETKTKNFLLFLSSDLLVLIKLGTRLMPICMMLRTKGSWRNSTNLQAINST